MPFSGFAGLARQRFGGGTGSFGNLLPNYSYGGFYDTGGSGLPGGSMRVPQDPRTGNGILQGVEFPVVGYPDTGWDPNQRLDYPFTNSIPGAGLPLRTDTGGAGQLTPFDPLGYGANPPPNDNVSPGGTRYYTNPVTGSRSNLYPDLSGAPPVVNPDYMGAPVPGYDMNNVGPNQNYTGYQTPVARAQPVRPAGFLGRIWRGLTGQPQGNFSYPVPGGPGGLPSTFGGGQSWQSNAARPSYGGGFSSFASAVGAGQGFGGGLASLGGGGWQTTSEFPSFSGSAAGFAVHPPQQQV